MIENQVYLNDRGIVEIHVVGNQTVESVRAMGDEALRLARQQSEAGKPARIIDNLLQMGTVPAEARKIVVELIKSNDYGKLAMLGKGHVLRLGANLMLQATGKGNHVRYFEDEAKCIAWLLKD